MKKLFIFTTMFLFSSGLFFGQEAKAAEDLCICQTGTEPANQVEIFKLGCRVWNLAQSCTKKMTVSLNTHIKDVLAKNPQAASVRLGYVGHWSSARQSLEFLKTEIVPAIKKYNVSFNIDNTACLATDNPYVILNYFKKIPHEAAQIEFRGNQAISTGLWDRALGGSNNFWAKISGEKLRVTFPSCKSFENKSCLGIVQQTEEGVCYDSTTQSHVFLKCEERQVYVTRLVDRRIKRVVENKGFWVREKVEFDIKTNGNTPYIRARNGDSRFSKITFRTEQEAREFLTRIKNDVRYLLIKEAN